jgi:DNA repair protein RecN (Recombination protein N)
MLISLHVRNYVIIDELMLDFQPGMTVISGETGAGKSIIMDALELAAGGRADSQVIKQGEARCDITASFDVAHNTKAKKWLVEQELLSMDDEIQECVFRRSISSDGRSRSTINGQLFPVQKTRELAQHLLDIHGQHEHQSLLKPDTHRIQLDEYAEHLEQCEQVLKHYKICQTLQAEREKLSFRLSDAQLAHRTLLQYQLDELEQAELQEGEAVQLHLEHKQLSEVDMWLQEAQHIQQILASDDALSLRSLLQSAQHALPKENYDQWKNLRLLLNNMLIQCQEAETEVKHLLSSTEADPDRLQIVEKRVQQLHALARKHHTTMEDLPALQQRLMDELATFEQGQEKKELLEKQYQEAEALYHQYAEKLSISRQKSAVKLGEAITQWLHQLGLPHAKLAVNIESTKQIRSFGYDKVEYYLVTNPNYPPRPLIKVASGGELSRISLAIEVVTTQHNQDLTRLFDEIDVGIGGHTAAVVGKLLRALGEKSQLLCITHQPQTAAQGHQHLLVEKKILQKENQSVAHFYVHELNKDNRVNEIARMLGGFEMTANTLAHAADLLKVI